MQAQVIGLWLFALISGAAVVYGVDAIDMQMSQTQAPLASRIIFNGFSRLLWGLDVTWVILACVYGYAGQITVLSLI